MGWVLGAVTLLLVVYIILRLVYVYFFCGGNDTGNYYSDSDK